MTQRDIDQIIRYALAEDHAKKDITSHILVKRQHRSEAYILSREQGIVSGVDLVKRIFHLFDSKVLAHAYCPDGASIKPNQPVIFLKGSTRSLLACERVALNFLAMLSGIATLTAEFVKRAGPRVKILDTRKTTPGLRSLEKAAVRHGGGQNHRHNLNDMVLIKDNHLCATHKNLTLKEVVYLAKRKTSKPIEIEVDTLKQFEEVLEAKPDIILLDNMSPAQLRKAVQIRNAKKSRIQLEASGGINLQSIKTYAQTGVDRISTGQLTHSAQSLDFSLEFVK